MAAEASGLDYIVSDAAGHFFAGVTLSLLDYASYRFMTRRQDRIEQKEACLRSMEVILDANTTPVNVPQGPQRVEGDSVQYALNVQKVQDYFRKTGLVKMDLPLFQRARDFFRDLVYDERINDLTNPQKFVFAIAAEIVYDSWLGWKYYTHRLGESPLFSFGRNIYQIPVFFFGLWAGNGTKTAVNWLFTSRKERKLDKTIQQLMHNTGIVDMVLDYEPSETVQERLQEEGVRLYASNLTRAGKNMYERLKKVAVTAIAKTREAADAVVHHGERQREQEKKEREALRSRFDEITKGR